MTLLKRRNIFLITITLLVGCLEPYVPPVTQEDTDILVIHGHINSTNNSATVTLSRSVSLSETIISNPETNADVFIVDHNDQETALNELTAGVYSVNKIFDYNTQYRLRVITKGKTYSSNLISLVKTQPIDSITWSTDAGKLEIFANTHDFSEGTKYYRYICDETYEYRSYYRSDYYFSGGQVVPRPPDERIYQCWSTKTLNSILLTSTETLSQNTVVGFKLQEIEKGNPKIYLNYSLLVKQVALDKNAYDYWYQLQKLTESLGGLFDPIPFSIVGNITSESDPSEVVVGYFSGGDVREERIIIGILSLPLGFGATPIEDCEQDMIPLATVGTLINGPELLVSEWTGDTLLGYFYTSPLCADCRLKGGTNIKPDFLN
jgi:hypothetical protein